MKGQIVGAIQFGGMNISLEGKEETLGLGHELGLGLGHELRARARA